MDRPISTIFLKIGLSSAAEQAQARAVLEAAGITRPGRLNMAQGKEDRARSAISAALAFHCANEACRIGLDRMLGGRLPALVEKFACEVCGGSDNRASLERMAQAMAAAKMSRIVVVGGHLPRHTALRDMSPVGIDWRFIDGTRRVISKGSTADLAWADVVAVWAAATPLAHTVSAHYTSHAKTIIIPQSGIAALADEVARYANYRRFGTEHGPTG
jgi:hypothetical protein